MNAPFSLVEQRETLLAPLDSSDARRIRDALVQREFFDLDLVTGQKSNIRLEWDWDALPRRDRELIRPPEAEAQVAQRLKQQKPVINIDPGRYDQVHDEAVAALAGARDIYNRDGVLVRLAGSSKLAPLSADLCRVELARVADWEKSGRKGAVPADPPADIARAIVGASDWPAIKPITAVVSHPIVFHDGSILEAGYNPATRIVGQFDPSLYDIPSNPTRSDAEAALGVMLKLLETFDLDRTCDTGAALAAMLTAVCRPALRTAPLLLITAPVAGSGKGLLARTISHFAEAREPDCSTLGENEEEVKKEIIAALISGAGVIFYDELSGQEVDGPDLRTLATSEKFTGRYLGQSKTVTLSTRALVLMTGNNIVAAADTARRMMEIRLRPACEAPSLRTFNYHPISDGIGRDPERFISAALTLQLAYFHAGAPRPAGALTTGSFESWDLMCRFPILWAMGRDYDPAARMQQAINLDPRKNELIAVLSAWRGALGVQPYSTAQVMERIEGYSAGPEAKALKATLLDACGRGGTLSPRAVGRYLSKNKDRIAGGLMLAEATMQSGSARWQVIEK